MWVADFAFAHDALSGRVLAATGAAGAIGYVSDHPEKNLTAANLADLAAHGIPTVLVFEDTTDDMMGGAPLGAGHAVTAVAEARSIGYDPEACTILFADDRNTGPADWPTVLEYMDAAAARVRWPGYYGDQDSIDWLAPQRPDWVYWQSDSLAYGTGVSRNAHLVQHYNDVRSAGLPLDVSDVQRAGVRWFPQDAPINTPPWTRGSEPIMSGQYEVIHNTTTGALRAIGPNFWVTLEAPGNPDQQAKNVANALTGPLCARPTVRDVSDEGMAWWKNFYLGTQAAGQ